MQSSMAEGIEAYQKWTVEELKDFLRQQWIPWK